MLPRMQAGIEAARPLPLINVDRNASALFDRTHTDVAAIDVPGHLVRVAACGLFSSEGAYPTEVVVVAQALHEKNAR